MRRLDYLESLGVDVVWLAPFQPSPNRDNGYDVADFYGVDPRYGSGGDFVEFVHRARSNGIRVICDLVVNHTSDRHRWFREAREGPGSPRFDWYVWSKKRPSTWRKGTVFPGHQQATWTRDPEAKQWYFHRFFDFQPDLNMQNPAVREEIRRIMAYWLELGVSGFRVDAVPFIIEEPPTGDGAAEAPLRVPRGAPRLPPVARRRRRSPRRGERAAEGGAGLLPRRRRHPPDVQLLGQPAPLVRARERRRAAAPEGAARHGEAPAELPVGALPPQPRRARPRPPDRGAAGDRVRALRPGRGHAAVRARDPPAARGDARRAAAGRARVQRPLLAAGDAGALVRRRARDGGRPAPAAAGRRAHADAVVGRAQRRLHQGGEAVPARGLARPVRLRARERRAPAAARRLAAPLEHADDPAAQGVPGDRLGRLAPAGNAEPGRARAPLRLARRRPPRAPQLRAGGVRGDVRHRGPARRAAVEPHRAGRRSRPSATAATASRSRRTARPGTGSARSTTRSTRRPRTRARAGRARRGRCRRRGSPRSP